VLVANGRRRQRAGDFTKELQGQGWNMQPAADTTTRSARRGVLRPGQQAAAATIAAGSGSNHPCSTHDVGPVSGHGSDVVVVIGPDLAPTSHPRWAHPRPAGPGSAPRSSASFSTSTARSHPSFLTGRRRRSRAWSRCSALARRLASWRWSRAGRSPTWQRPRPRRRCRAHRPLRHGGARPRGRCARRPTRAVARPVGSVMRQALAEAPPGWESSRRG